MNEPAQAIGKTIQLFLVDGSPNSLIIASIHGWTGSVLVATQTTFGKLLARPEVKRTGVYVLYGPDAEMPGEMRAYIGEADSVRERIDKSAGSRTFWEGALVITTSDEALTKGHVRYLEARLIEMARAAARVILDNDQKPEPERRRMPEADKVNMEAFIANLKIILPVVGLDLLKPQPKVSKAQPKGDALTLSLPRFKLKHKSNIKAEAVEENEEFVVLENSQALKDTAYARNSYAKLKSQLVQQGVLMLDTSSQIYRFTRAYAFRSPSAAGSVILDRNTNGRTRWRELNSGLSYHDWQEAKALSEENLK